MEGSLAGLNLDKLNCLAPVPSPRSTYTALSSAT